MGPLCKRHHHDIHDRGWIITLDPERNLTITLPDGTSATSAGYAVSFDSGLSWPQPVPEPLPAAAWAIVGLAGAFIARRRVVASTRN